jgi:hypothetical protein
VQASNSRGGPKRTRPPEWPAAYVRAADRLAHWLQQSPERDEARRQKAEPGPSRVSLKAKAARELAGRLDAIVHDLNAGPLSLEMHAEYEAPQPVRFDAAGVMHWPKPRKLSAALACLRDLAAAARAVADTLPDSRRRATVPDAVTLWLHLLYACKLPRPTLYGDGWGVVELQRVLEHGRYPLARVTVRHHLRDALQSFDPLDYPDALPRFLE